MIVRKALEKDFITIEGLYKKVIGTPGCTWNNEYPTIDEIKEDYKFQTLYVLEKEGKIIGAMSVVPENELDDLCFWKYTKNCKEIARIVIDIENQNHGYAKYLITEVINELKDKEVKAIHLLVAKQNEITQKLYKALGFIIKGECFMYDNDYYGCEKELI